MANDEVYELSVRETQALRLKLGLPPLRGVPDLMTNDSPTHVEKDTPSIDTDGTERNNEEEIVLSVDETNALRKKIGLTQLRISSQGGTRKGSSASNPIHVVPTDLNSKNEVIKRIEDASAKRDAAESVKKLKEENDAASNEPCDDLAAFASRMRQSGANGNGSSVAESCTKGKKKRKKTSKKLAKNPRLALQGDEGEIICLNKPDVLKGTKVSYAASDFEAGSTTVLTLTDKPILDIDQNSKAARGLTCDGGDDIELINVGMESDRAQLENLHKKNQMLMGAGRGGGYTGYDDEEFEELGGTGPNAGNGKSLTSRGMTIGEDSTTFHGGRKEKKSDLFSGLTGKAISLEGSRTNEVASDFITYEEDFKTQEAKNEKERNKMMKRLAKLKNKTAKEKIKNKKRRSKFDDEDDVTANENEVDLLPSQGGSLLKTLEATADKNDNLEKKNKRRRLNEQTANIVENALDDDNSTEREKVDFAEINKPNNNEGNDTVMQQKRDHFFAIMKKSTARTDNAFAQINQSSGKMEHSPHSLAAAAEEKDDDAFLNAALSKGRRIQRLKELSAKSSVESNRQNSELRAGTVLQAITSTNERGSSRTTLKNDSTGEKNGISFEFDEMQEFTRALLARKEQSRRLPKRNRGINATISGTAESNARKTEKQQEEIKNDVNLPVSNASIEELARKISDEGPGNEETTFGSTAESIPIGRGVSNFLSLLKQTGEMKYSGREEMRGRAKDKRTYEDYENLNLEEVVKIDTKSAPAKDVEFANREIKLEYRDDYGRLLTRKEAYRNMCYQFHGYGSSKKNQERRLKQMTREREEGKLASRQVMAESGVGTLGAFKATQKATGKAFIVHKT